MKEKKYSKLSSEDKFNSDEKMENLTNGDGVKKKVKRKIDEEKIPDEKKIKLDNGNDKLSEESSNNCHENNETNGEIMPENESKNEITGKYMRKMLNNTGGIGILRKFISLCKNEKNDKDLAGEYLEAKGSVLEILRLLDNVDKKNTSNIAIIFSAMQILIMKIISKYPQYCPNTEQTCRHFINTHLSSVHSLLSSQSSPQNRKICLRLLTAIVTLGGNLPRELLGHLTFSSQTLELLCQQTKPSEKNNVRTCFIHFIVSFLVDGSINVIRGLLEKRGMITCIFSGLIYDRSTIVHLVLNTIKTFILENNLVSKTTKLHLFSTPVIQSLVCLYNWKGPTHWPGNNPKKQQKSFSGTIDPEEKQIAIEAVHEFLLLLLTSTRHGIIFNDKTLGTSGRKHNPLVNSVLQSLDKPWEHEKPRELVTKILSTSPDLIKSQLTFMEPLMAPRLSTKWLQLIKFIQSIIIDINYEQILIPNLKELTLSQLISASLTLSLPQIVLKNAIQPAINNSNIILRHHAMETLKIMLDQLKKIFNSLKKNNLPEKIYLQFKRAICDYILKNSPNLCDLMRICEEDENLEEIPNEIELIEKPKKINHFLLLIDLLQIYRDICPEYLEEFHVNHENVEPIKLLKCLKKIQLENDEEKLIEVKIKLINFILSLNPKIFIDSEFFSDNLIFLIGLINNNNESSKAIATIKMILIAAEIFEGTEDQIDIWINSFKLINNKININELSKWFVKILQKTMKNKEEYLNQLIEAEERTLIDEKINKNSGNIFNELYERINLNIKSTMQSPQSIPLLLCAALENLNKKPNDNVSNYLSLVTVLTMHCQINPIGLINFAEKIDDLPIKYLTSWKQCGNSIKKPFSTDNFVRKFSKILLENEEIDWENLFDGEKKLEINLNELKIIINYSMDNYEIFTLYRMTLFYLTQLVRHNELNNEQLQRFKLAIIILLNIAIDFCENNEEKIMENYLELIFTNPIFLQYFSPLADDKSKDNALELMITNEFIYEILKIMREKFNGNFSKLLTGFKQKFLVQIKLLIDKSMNGWRIETINFNFNKFIELLEFNSEDYIKILRDILELSSKIILSTEKNNLSSWGEIIPHLLELSVKNEEQRQIIEQSSEIIKKILNHYSQLIKTKINLEVWNKSLFKYLQKYPHNISLIDSKLFKTLFQRELTTTTINLIGLLINRNNKLIPQLIEIVTNNSTLIKNPQLIFQTISTNLNHKWDVNYLKKIYEQYKDDIFNYLTFQSTENWINNYLNSTIYLINSTFNSEICDKIINTILSSGDKLEGININYIKLLRSLIKKNTELELNEKKNQSIINFIQILIRIGVTALKKNTTDERLKLICNYLCESVDDLVGNKILTLEEINKNNSWPQFSRFSLKIGLKSSPKDEEKNSPPRVLKTLEKLCSIAYKDKSENDYVKIIFEMLISHSEFMNTIFGNNLEKKCDLLKLIYTLIKKNHLIMVKTHVPLYLSAYNATMSECDRVILMILQEYEGGKIKLNEYKPYFWGEAAKNFYSIKGETDTALWRQPSTSQIIDLFNVETVVRTIENYPVRRGLGGNFFERVDDCVYDPAFFLPVVTNLLADYNVVKCSRVAQNGILALVFAACGSLEDDTRTAAFTVLARFYFHLEATSHKDKLLWMRILDGLRNGLSMSIKDTKISCLVSTFLAKASLVSTQPLNPLFSPIQSFFMAKPALDLNTIPEFLTLFHSSDSNYKINRQWILEIIRDGIKSEFDVDLSFKCVLFRMLFDFYHCVLADSSTKNLILEIVNSTVKIPKSQSLLIRGYSLIVWLNNVINNLTHDTTNIKLVINIMKNLVDNIIKTNDRDNNLYMLLITMKNLSHKLTKDLEVDELKKYLTSLNNLTSTKLFCEIIQLSDIELLINLCNEIQRVDNFEELIDICSNGCEFIDRELMNGKNVDDNIDVNFVGVELKKLLIHWHDLKIQM